MPPCVVERPDAKRGVSDRAVCNVSEARASVVKRPPVGGTRGSRAGQATAKATEGAWDPEAGAEEPSGVLGVERADGRPGNSGEPSWPRRCGWREAMPAYNRRTREVVRVVERQSERVVVLRGRESRPHGEGPALHRCTGRMRRTLMSAESARSVSRATGVDRVRALQRVLYRCAQQDPDRRFHALYDKGRPQRRALEGLG